MEQEGLKLQEEPNPSYSKANFKRLFTLAREECDKQSEDLSGFFDDVKALQTTEGKMTQEKNDWVLPKIEALFDQLTELTTKPKSFGRRVKIQPNSNYTKVIDYKNYIISLIQSGDIKPEVIYFFLKNLLSSDGHCLQTAKIIRDAMIMSPEFDQTKHEEILDLIRRKVAEIAEIMPQHYRPKGAMPELPFYFSPPSKHKIGNKSPWRIYINPSIFKDPRCVVESIKKALSSHSGHGLYLEFNGLGRQDGITIYCCSDDLRGKDGHECSAEKVLSSFAKACKSSHLINGGNPLGFPLMNGISAAPEPPISLLVEVLSFRQSVSHKLENNMITALMILCAFVLAKKDKKKADHTFDLEDGTESYYGKLQKISKINSKTLMTMDIDQGRVPQWMLAFSQKYGFLED